MTTHGEVKDGAKSTQSFFVLVGGQGVRCQHQEVGGGGQGHQGVDHQDGGSRQDVGGPSW